MIKIRRSEKYKLWTVYRNGKAVAGLTHPIGFFIGQCIVAFIWRRLYIQYKGRRLI